MLSSSAIGKLGLSLHVQIGLNDLSSKFKKCTLSRNELDDRRALFFFFGDWRFADPKLKTC